MYLLICECYSSGRPREGNQCLGCRSRGLRQFVGPATADSGNEPNPRYYCRFRALVCQWYVNETTPVRKRLGFSCIVSVIPSESQLKFGVRAPTAREVMDLMPRVLNCFKAGALSSGCTYDIKVSHVYLDLQPCTKLEEFYQEHCQSRWGSEGYDASPRSAISASTDFVSAMATARSLEAYPSSFAARAG